MRKHTDLSQEQEQVENVEADQDSTAKPISECPKLRGAPPKTITSERALERGGGSAKSICSFMRRDANQSGPPTAGIVGATSEVKEQGRIESR